LSSDRLTRRFACLGLLGLAGCGFVPVYGNGPATRGQFSFETDASVIGFQLGTRLSERLGTASTPRYVLKVAVRTSERAAAITAEGDTVRLNIIGIADWSIVESASGEQIFTDRTEAFASYAATGSTVATQTTQDDARARLAIILADMIVTRVLALSETLDP
jgi:LPS-assembly lipoprotein